jgi:hypothetical protein
MSHVNFNETAPTQFQDIGGVSLAYRRFGKEGCPPVVCFQHFTGTIDNFDPIHTNRLAQDRASFDRQALATGKAQINRASLPPQSDLLAAYGEYVASLSWPGFQARIVGFGQRIAEKGLVEIELNLGSYIGGAKA